MPSRYSTTVTGPKYCQKALEKAEAVLDELEVEESGPHHEDFLKSCGVIVSCLPVAQWKRGNV